MFPRERTNLAQRPLGLFVICLVLVGLSTPKAQSSLTYPLAPRVTHVDHYHGHDVPDPYRPLEDMSSPATQAWVREQNQLTAAYLNAIPFRAQVQARVRELTSYTRYMGSRGQSATQAGHLTFFRKLEPGKSQPTMYVVHKAGSEPEVLLDPNTWSEDGTATLGQFAPSRDGKYVVYGIRQGGSDWAEYRVMEVDSRRTLPDRLQWIIGGYTAWLGHEGFFYARLPQPPTGKERSVVREHHAVYFHRLGTPQSADKLVHREPEFPKRHFNVMVSRDERTLILLSSPREGGPEYNGIKVRQIRSSGPWISVVADAPSAVDVIDVAGHEMLVFTRLDAPKGHVARVDLRSPKRGRWRTIVPESGDVMEVVSTGGGRLFVRLLRDVKTKLLVYKRDGALEREVALPGPGLAFGFSGDPEHRSVYYTFTSLAVPDTIYRYDIESGASSVFAESKLPGYAADMVKVSQVFYPAKDGTRIPMFLMHRKDLRLDGNNPTLLHGYGAFGAKLWPWFDGSRLALIEQGFVFAMANIRGGGEYGQAWHDAGRRLNRQTAFDDFIAAAEWLVEQKYTRPAKLAAHGVSSGGTLVAAVINQRPELFGAAVPEAGVMDMLRFQKFTGGFNWTAETGSSDDPTDFKFLLGYSPIHNIRSGIQYPAILVTAADHDDRVVPAHSYKYVATLQERVHPSRPALIRIDTKSGHADSSIDKASDRQADIFVFLMHVLGAPIKFD